MSSGINSSKVETLKIELLDYIESINAIVNRLDISIGDIQNNMDGIGKREIINKLNEVKGQLPNVKENIVTYIDDLDRAISIYKSVDYEVAATLMNNISKLGEGRD